MKIEILSADQGLADGGRKVFTRSPLSIGRDAACDLHFEKSAYPMVSRQHAQLVFEKGTWRIVDSNSSYGTYLNGARVSDSHLAVGDSIQFGTNGPSIKIASIENAVAAGDAPTAEVRFPQQPARAPVPVDRAEITFGRDPASAVAFSPDSVMVSRHHAAIVRSSDGSYLIEDRGSFNGTFLNDERITAAAPLAHGDRLRFGTGGPTAEFYAPSLRSSFENSLANERLAHLVSASPNVGATVNDGKTMVARLADPIARSPSKGGAEPQLIMSLAFGNRSELIVGRSPASDIKLDGLNISARHARLRPFDGGVSIEDLGSTNGVFVNGAAISSESLLPEDTAQIGPFAIKVDAAGTVFVFDTRAKVRLDASHLSRSVKAKGGRFDLLKDVSLSIQPNELVAIIGPSGSGKTSLLNVLSGGARPDDGNVFVNSRDLYRELASLKQSIGVVPQDDLIHSELSVYRTLFYIAKLRLSRDISGAEIDRAIAEILDVTGLSAKRDLPVSKLSGGQRKRASVAVELLTKPSLLLLDEPTAGLDPRTERSMMGLFRQIADSGRTVVVTTHAADSVSLFDKVAVLMHGRLVYFGKPDEALRAFNVPDIATLFDRLEAGDGSGASAESLRESYAASPDFQKYVAEPRSQISSTAPTARQKKSRLGLVGSIRQWLTLSRRYFEVLFKDKLNIALILAEAPIVALITLAAVDPKGPRDFIYFILAIVAIWFGTSISAREIVRERPIFKRERRVNLGLFPYVFSKLTVLGFLLAVQCILLFIPLKAADLVSPGTMPGDFFGIPQLWTVILSAGVGLSLGLFISTIVRTGTMAATLVPLVLIPQILLSGIIGVPNSVAKPLSMLVPAAWSFDTIKRFSGLPTLEPEGAEADGPTRGLGLLKQVETDNDAILAKARRDLDEYQKTTVEKLRKYDDDRIAGLTPPRPDLEEMPAIPNARKIPDDLSGYVTFLHPWMNEVLNQVILMLMFGVLIAATFVVLKLRDIR